MKPDFKSYTLLMLILVVAVSFVARVPVWDINQGYWWDEAVYLGLGKNLAEGKGYSINIGDEKFRPPLLPFIISLLINNGEWVIRLIFPVFGILGVVLTYLLAERIYERKTAIIAALLVSSSELYIFYGQKILTETLSLVLFTAGLYFLHRSLKDRKYIAFTAVFAALSVLIRYTNGVFLLIFLIYLIYMKKLDMLKSKEFMASVAIFLLILSPWIYMNSVNYGNPVGSLIDNLGHAPPEYSPGPFYFYVINAVSIFGLPILFLVPFIFMIGREESDALTIISITVIIVAFSFIARKELRYLIPYASVFYIASARGAVNLMKRMGDKLLIPGILAVLIFLGFFSGIQMCVDDSVSGRVTVEAAEYIKTLPSEYFLAENYPVISYISGKKVYMYPPEEKFGLYVSEYNITHIVVDSWDVVSPPYVKEKAENMELAATFERENHVVRVYEIGRTAP